MCAMVHAELLLALKVQSIFVWLLAMAPFPHCPQAALLGPVISEA